MLTPPKWLKELIINEPKNMNFKMDESCKVKILASITSAIDILGYWFKDGGESYFWGFA